MFEMKSKEVAEIQKPEAENYKGIKPEGNSTIYDAKNFWDKIFEKMEIKELVTNYIKDLKSKSEFSDTIPDKPFKASELKKTPIEENAVKREEFSRLKSDLIQQWEEKNQCSWPTYKNDVYITNKKGEQVKIREAGSKYDAHHIQPLGLGGKNEVSNITPLRADVHYDHRGVHALGSAYDNLNKMCEVQTK